MPLTREEYARRTDELVAQAEQVTAVVMQQNDDLERMLEHLKREHP